MPNISLKLALEESPSEIFELEVDDELDVEELRDQLEKEEECQEFIGCPEYAVDKLISHEDGEERIWLDCFDCSDMVGEVILVRRRKLAEKLAEKKEEAKANLNVMATNYQAPMMNQFFGAPVMDPNAEIRADSAEAGADGSGEARPGGPMAGLLESMRNNPEQMSMMMKMAEPMIKSMQEDPERMERMFGNNPMLETMFGKEMADKVKDKMKNKTPEEIQADLIAKMEKTNLISESSDEEKAKLLGTVGGMQDPNMGAAIQAAMSMFKGKGAGA